MTAVSELKAAYAKLRATDGLVRGDAETFDALVLGNAEELDTLRALVERIYGDKSE